MGGRRYAGQYKNIRRAQKIRFGKLEKDEIDLDDVFVNEEAPIEETATTVRVCYCRVSTYGQKDDLDRQIKYMSNKYPEHTIISDVGSGINFNRKGLKKIIDYAITGKLEELVVSYKDRICRIGYQLIEYICKTYSGTNIIIDMHEDQSIDEEIAKDILEIITVYSAKIHGMRRYTQKTADSND